MKSLDKLLHDSATHHHRLCPRQVLGARVGMFAASLLTLDLPQSDKRLLAFIETDGCFVDGVSAATGCTVGHRTLRVEDLGKTAAAFVDTRTECAVRVDCDARGEEIINQREVIWDSNILCRACAGQSYFCFVEHDMELQRT